jgi:Flp pilus assembly pilin Flp
MRGEGRNVLSRFAAYRAETQMLVEYALVLAVIVVLAVAAFTVFKPVAVALFTDFSTAL